MANLTPRGDLIEISSLYGNSAEGNLITILSMRSPNGPQLFFTDAVAYKNGRKLHDLIKRVGVGEVVKPEQIYNPNSARDVEVFMFQPNEAVCKEFLASITELRQHGHSMTDAVNSFVNGYRAGDKKKEEEKKAEEDKKETPKGKGYKTEAGASRGIEGRELTHRIVFRDGLFRIVRR